MNKNEKTQFIDDLADRLSNTSVFYLADTSALTVETTNKLRRSCFNQGIKMEVVKNTLLRKALEKVEGSDYAEIYDVLAGPTALMTSEVGNAPAKLIKEFRKKHDKPILKAAYIDTAIFIGDNQVDSLAALKSKEELVGEIIGLLQSPMKNVISGLKASAGGTIAGLVKTLQERPE